MLQLSAFAGYLEVFGRRRFHLWPRRVTGVRASVLPRRTRQADHFKRCRRGRFSAPSVVSAVSATGASDGRSVLLSATSAAPLTASAGFTAARRFRLIRGGGFTTCTVSGRSR